jgi:SAM-dependent methyltransferase
MINDKETGIKRYLKKGFLIIRSAFKQLMYYTNKRKWKRGIQSELRFWDDYFRTKGLEWHDTYGERFNPNLPLQHRLSALLPPQEKIEILDVGAGPLTFLGKKSEGKRIYITAIDPLADEYDKLFAKYHIVPLVRTEKLDAEKLTTRFPENTFDLVFARNCIDHAYNPECAIIEMIKVVKKGCYVLMEHRVNEAEKEGYRGLHQWNFSMTIAGEFLINGKCFHVNFSEKYNAICQITCELDTENWLITKILKR